MDYGVCFCSHGAIWKTTPSWKTLPSNNVTLVVNLLNNYAKDYGYLSYMDLNDGSTHEQVMAMFDSTIKKARLILKELK